MKGCMIGYQPRKGPGYATFCADGADEAGQILVRNYRVDREIQDLVSMGHLCRVYKDIETSRRYALPGTMPVEFSDWDELMGMFSTVETFIYSEAARKWYWSRAGLDLHKDGLYNFRPLNFIHDFYGYLDKD